MPRHCSVSRMILQPAEFELVVSLVRPDMDVIELGNKKNKQGLYRTWYEERGTSYRCLDINGEDGAEVVDFRTDLDIGDADLVTNFGFTEHVGPLWGHQETCWRNVVNLVRVGGYLVCVTPQPGRWPQHGMWQPTLKFYEAFAATNGFQILLLDEYIPLSKNDARPVVRAVMRRKYSCTFLWTGCFQELMHRTEITEEY